MAEDEDDVVSFTIGDHESLVSAERLERRRASRTVNAAAVPSERPDLEENKENLCDVLLEFPKRYGIHCLVTYHLVNGLSVILAKCPKSPWIT